MPPEIKQPAKDSKVASAENISKIYNVNLMIAEYRAYGHLFANLDPLGLERLQSAIKLDLQHYGLSEVDLDLVIELNHESLGLSKCTIRQLIAKLREVYCSNIGYELQHLISDEEKNWFYERIEKMNMQFSQRMKELEIQLEAKKKEQETLNLPAEASQKFNQAVNVLRLSEQIRDGIKSGKSVVAAGVFDTEFKGLLNNLNSNTFFKNSGEALA